MGSIRTRKDTGNLFFDFIFHKMRCREQTTLSDTPENRRKMEKVLKHLEAEITLGTFDYAKYFPNSPMLKQFTEKRTTVSKGMNAGDSPLFKDFIWEWFQENRILWKHSYRETIRLTARRYLIPWFGDHEVGRITRADILKFRASLAEVANGARTGLSNDRVNHVMTPLGMVLAEAADRFTFTTPFVAIKPLRVPKSNVDPFSLDEVTYFLAHVRPDFRNYYAFRFYTGMRTSEVDGLKWKYVNFERPEIYVRETIVYGRMETAKTVGSERTIQMSQPVFDALTAQFALTGHLNGFVFCNRAGSPYNYHNINTRVWFPTLKRLGLKRRTAYQTRHTTATLWLASGENPEWISRQLGHTSTKMLFSVYSRYIPNLTRMDGSAFERLLLNQTGGK